MSTSLAVDLESLYLNNCLSLVIVTAVAYDYVLTFSTEIEYVWKRRWTWVSTMFLLVRYGGLLAIMATGLAGTTFVPGPLWVRFFYINSQLNDYRVRDTRCKGLFYVAWWMTTIFTVASDLVMIFRVYALYGQSRTILGVLLVIYIGEFVANVIASAIYSTPGSAIVMIPPAPDPSVCIVQYPSWNWGRYSAIPVVVLQGMMCLLAVYQCFRQSLHLHNATRRWRLNMYVKLVVEQGILYFVINFLRATITQGLFSIPISQTLGLVLTSTLSILMFALNPRFILSIRELYSHTYRGQGVDTGFGMLSRHGFGTSTDLETLPRFAGVTLGSGGEVEEIEQVPMGKLRRKEYVDGL